MTYYEKLIDQLPDGLDAEVDLLVQKAYYQGFTDGNIDARTGHGARYGWIQFIGGVRAGGLWPFGNREG